MGSIVPFLLRALDSDAARMCNEGGIGGAAERRAVSNLAKGLKRAGLWSSMYALYPFAGGSSQAHAQNLISASYPITWVNSPTHDSNGVTFNGSTNYGQCVGLTGNTVVPHLCGQTLYLRTTNTESTGAAGRYCGILNAGFTILYSVEYLDIAASECNRGIAGAVANYMTDTAVKPQKKGVLSVNRTSTTSQKGYHNGTEYLSNTTLDSSTPPSLDFWLGAANFNNAAASYAPENFALYAVHSGLTAEQAATFSTLIAEYQTALGRNV